MAARITPARHGQRDGSSRASSWPSTAAPGVGAPAFPPPPPRWCCLSGWARPGAGPPPVATHRNLLPTISLRQRFCAIGRPRRASQLHPGPGDGSGARPRRARSISAASGSAYCATARSASRHRFAPFSLRLVRDRCPVRPLRNR